MELRLYGDYEWQRRPILVVAAEREDAGRFIVHADEMLTAFWNYRRRFIVDLRLRGKVMRSSMFC